MTMRGWSLDASGHVSEELWHHLASLNPSQRYAVECENKPLLVLAGPGSGKTLVLSTRIARLILESANERFRILGLTFTRIAAQSMRDGVEHLLGPKTERVRLATFHSFCNEVLRQHGSHLGLRPDFQVIAHDADRLQILREVVRESDFCDMPTLREERVMTIVDHLLRDGYDGGDETPLPYSGLGRDWIRKIYHAYVDTQLRNNGLDFGTLVVCATRLFREHTQVAKHYRVVYPHVCVDEFQDTNKSQNLLLRALYPQDTTNLFAVAHEDESMFQRYGAKPIYIEKLRQDYRMSVIRLPESYRCPPAFVELANNLIRFNQEQCVTETPPVAASDRLNAPTVRVRRFSDCNAEAAWIAHDIGDRSLDADGCAVLARNTRILRSVACALRRVGLSPYVVGGKNEFHSPLLQFVHSTLLLANAPQDTDHIWTLCKAYRALTGVDVSPEEAEAMSLVGGGSPLRGFLDAAKEKSAGPIDSAPLIELLREQLVERLSYRCFYESALKWWAELQPHPDSVFPSSEDVDEIKIWNELMYAGSPHSGSGVTLNQFLHDLDMRRASSLPKLGDILCSPIHRTKGMEFEHAYLAGLTENQFPSYDARYSGDGSRRIEEERRIWFVAITRARCSLTLTYAESYFGMPKKPSRFLWEMGLAEETVDARR